MIKNPYIELAECLLPEEMVENFNVVKVEKTKGTLDLTLEERDNGVVGYGCGQLRPNGFYDESVIRDYPVRGHRRKHRGAGAGKTQRSDLWFQSVWKTVIRSSNCLPEKGMQ